MELASLYFQFHAWWIPYRAIFNVLLIRKRMNVSKAFSVLFYLLFVFTQLTMLKRELARWWHSTDAVIRTRQKNGHKQSSVPASPDRWLAPHGLLLLVQTVRLLPLFTVTAYLGLRGIGSPLLSTTVYPGKLHQNHMVAMKREKGHFEVQNLLDRCLQSYKVLL